MWFEQLILIPKWWKYIEKITIQDILLLNEFKSSNLVRICRKNSLNLIFLTEVLRVQASLLLEIMTKIGKKEKIQRRPGRTSSWHSFLWLHWPCKKTSTESCCCGKCKMNVDLKGSRVYCESDWRIWACLIQCSILSHGLKQDVSSAKTRKSFLHSFEKWFVWAFSWTIQSFWEKTFLEAWFQWKRNSIQRDWRDLRQCAMRLKRISECSCFMGKVRDMKKLWYSTWKRFFLFLYQSWPGKSIDHDHRKCELMKSISLCNPSNIECKRAHLCLNFPGRLQLSWCACEVSCVNVSSSAHDLKNCKRNLWAMVVKNLVFNISKYVNSII